MATHSSISVFPANLESTSLEFSDDEVLREILDGDSSRFEILIRRYNQRMFRLCRSVLINDGEAEEAVQDAYFKAFQHLSQFAGRSTFGVWLAKIALHEALSRKRRLSRFRPLPADSQDGGFGDALPSRGLTPEQESLTGELGSILEESIDQLPDGYRAVFMLRQIEGLSTEETAACLNIGREAVKSRLHRSRQLLKTRIRGRYADSAPHVFRFLGVRCDRLTRRVMARIDGPSTATA